MTSAINRIVPDPKVIQVLTKSLAFENDNSVHKLIIGPLKTRIATIN